MNQQNLQQLEESIHNCMCVDQHSLKNSLRQIKKLKKQGKGYEKELNRLQNKLEKSQQHRDQRVQNLPLIAYPEELPISQNKDEIGKAIRDNQVVVIAGETGSGKTTQLPKICLEQGRGINGFIGHTQPRRIAARTVATRIAEELKTPLGSGVGYKIRFSDKTQAGSYIKLMTDGILLAEIQSDPYLNKYDTLIIDEAHERSLNIDFLLGYIKRLLPKRPDLKLIITSATIDTERFSQHFINAPVISVLGRSYPVELRYRPYGADDDRDQLTAISDAVDELARVHPLGDILIFLATEREIRETAEHLRKHHLEHTELLPLFSRLTPAEQNRVFQSHKGRRIILATNVAETSLTVPGIRFVIDTGTARISRYSFRSKVQRLPIEKVSQASANQRKGRCGRVAEGTCIRLYDEPDFLSRPEFTEPEIRRTNLANVILQMASLNLGEIEHFPFPDPPEGKFISDGKKTLFELGALNENGTLTSIGTQLAKLPIDARVGRMLLAAKEQGCLEEVLIIASALSVRDPRERPADTTQKADEAHKQFQDEKSDFITLLNLWQSYHQQAKHLTQNKLRKWCEKQFLSYMRMREWLDIHSQLLSQLKDMQFIFNRQPAEHDTVHRALLSGLLSHVAMRSDSSEFTGARNRKLRIFPNSSLFKKPPKWIMAAEVVETSQIFARVVATIQPQWIESQASHLCKESYFDAHWEKKTSQVTAYAKVNLFGLTINQKKRVNYGPINPTESREIFIQSALVEGNYAKPLPFLQHNGALLKELEALEHKSRRQDVIVDDHQLFQFYDSLIPDEIYSGPAFEKWLKSAVEKDKTILFLNKNDLMRHEAQGVTEQQFPDKLTVSGVGIPITYHFLPGHPRDGVSAFIPLQLLNQLSAEPFTWMVPGLIREKITTLLKALPKNIRRNFVPLPQFVDDFLTAYPSNEGSLYHSLEEFIKKRTAITLNKEQWDAVELPKHLQVNFVVLDDAGTPLAEGRELGVLQQLLKSQSQAQFSTRPTWEKEQTGITDWSFGELTKQVEFEHAGLSLTGFPALIDEGSSITITLLDSEKAAANATALGLRRLFMLQMQQQLLVLQKSLPHIDKSCLFYAPIGRCDDLKKGIINVAFDMTFIDGMPPISNESQFKTRLHDKKGELVENANRIAKQLFQALEIYNQVHKRLNKQINPSMLQALGDIKDHLAHLMPKGFLTHTPLNSIRDLMRYMKGILYRIDKLEKNPLRDRQAQLEMAPLWQQFWVHYHKLEQSEQQIPASLVDYRWQLEELRISLFAQELGTNSPVSVKRLKKLWNELINN